jgi:poly(3-hydroxybutyrate) depolymerase
MTALLVLCALLADPEPLPSGPAKIEVQANGTPIDVFTYKPDGFDEGPLILVFHGVLRNADVYRGTDG